MPLRLLACFYAQCFGVSPIPIVLPVLIASLMRPGSGLRRLPLVFWLLGGGWAFWGLSHLGRLYPEGRMR
eukprot:7386436-Pyramimonas_sp.AAC.2